MEAKNNSATQFLGMVFWGAFCLLAVVVALWAMVLLDDVSSRELYSQGIDAAYSTNVVNAIVNGQVQMTGYNAAAIARIGDPGRLVPLSPGVQSGTQADPQREANTPSVFENVMDSAWFGLKVMLGLFVVVYLFRKK